MKAKLYDPLGAYLHEIDLGFAPPAILTIRPLKKEGATRFASHEFCKFELIGIEGDTANYRAVE